MSHTTSYGFLASCQNFEKTNDTIPRKLPDRRKDGHATCSFNKKYFGEMGRTIEERIKEHQADVNNEKSVQKITGLLQNKQVF